MKTIYLTIASALLIGNLSAQNLMKAADKTATMTPHSNARHTNAGTHSSHFTTRSVNATLSESFEGAVPPTGWAGGSTNAADWYSSTTSASEETVATGHNGHFAIFDNYDYDPGDEGYLITPTLMPTAGDNTLSYSVNVYNLSTNTAYLSTGAELYIDFSTDNGATWTSSTTNVLTGLANYNTTTNTGWTTLTASLAAYNGMNVKVRFKGVSDYGWSNLGLDNVTGPAVLSLTNDVAVNSATSTQINGFDYFEVVPNSQLATVDYGVAVVNQGAAAQTNVTLNANVNAGAYTSATGLNNPVTTMAAGEADTMWTEIMPMETTPTIFYAGVNVTQTETDEDLANNMADSSFFLSTDYTYFRSLELGSLLTSYSFGSAAPAVTGMEYGASYITPNIGRVDSISSLIYRSSGGGNIVGKLYTIDQTTGAFTNVATTAPFTPAAGTNTSGDLTTLALTTPYVATAGTLLVATIQLNITAGTDTIYVGSDNAYPGDASIAGAVYLKVGSAFQWASITGQVPLVGIQMQNGTVGINEHNAADMISVYPNPSTGLVTVNSAAGKSLVEVYNVLGAVVYSNEFSSPSNVIDLSAFGTGMYSVKVTTNKSVSVKKVMITK